MTIICAMHEPGVGTWVGSDRRVTSGLAIVSDITPKWAAFEGGGIAVTGSNPFRTAIFERSSEVEAGWSASELRIWLVSVWEGIGVRPKEEPGEASWFTGWTIHATPARILVLCPGFGTAAVPDKTLFACGSGSDAAEGAAYALRSAGVVDARQIVETSVHAAIKTDAGCGGEPFVHLLRVA